MLALRSLGKRFGDVTVLAEIDLEVARGEVIAIIGPSGSGKSTLLRCMNLLEVPTSGCLIVSGEVILDVPPGSPTPHYKIIDAAAIKARRHSAMVFQRFNLFPHLRVLDNVTIGLIKVRKIANDEAERVGKALLK